MKIAIFWIVVMYSGIFPVRAETLQDCREWRDFSAVDYWFWDGYLGLTDLVDTGTKRQGRLAHEPSICFKVDLKNLDNWLARTKGYKRAIDEWFKWVPLGKESWSKSPKALQARKRIEEITGETFDSREEWKKWWIENSDYLIWSDKEARLVVSAQAKEAGRPIVEEIEEISPSDYWYLFARGWLEDVKEQAGFIRAKAWIPPEGYQKVRVRKELLDNRQKKQEGYVRAMKNLILDGLALPQLQGKELEKVMARVRSLTDVNYESRDEWIQWWNNNQDSLVLSEDGERLTVK